MADNNFCEGNMNEIKEAVCIDALRIYDSCSDKDCIEDTRVYFSPANQELVDCATNVRIKDVSVISVYLDLQPIPFNRGFYSVDMTFFFDVAVDLFTTPSSATSTVNGISMFNKKVILYGSEGNVKVFTSDDECEDKDYSGCRAVPKAIVQVAEPIALSAKLCDARSCCYGCDNCGMIPKCITAKYGDEIQFNAKNNVVYATIGLFIIVQIVRNTQMLIPAYDFCIPDKECVSSSDNPCDLFRQIEFPVGEFFPPKNCEYNKPDCGCK